MLAAVPLAVRHGTSRAWIARTGAPRPSAVAMVASQHREIDLDARIYDFNTLIINTVKGAVDVWYKDKDYARFYVLETVARVPYFAYLSVMHLQETFGNRKEDLRQRMRTHYAEADHELHHLLIMEALGGNADPLDRTIAQTMAFFYYWYVVAVYLVSEQAAYHLSELIEDHAYHTYDNFLKRNAEELRQHAVPAIARSYYEEPDPFLLDLFCSRSEIPRPPEDPSRPRPRLENLYDVFVNIRDDEREHWQTLCQLVQHDHLPAMDECGVFIESTPRRPDASPLRLPLRPDNPS